MTHSELFVPASKKAIRSWMLFDWAAQPFFTVVITFIFGPYFVSRLALDPVAGQAAWGYTITIAGVAIALMAPILGAVADATGARKRWIAFFAALKIIALLLLWFAAPGSTLWLPMVCVIVAMIAAEFSIVFNDSMMPRLIAQEDIGRVSNLAWGLGYLGGLVVLFSVLLLLAGNPETGKTLLGITPLFGLDAMQGEDARITGPYAALWYLIFILPMFMFTPDSSKGISLKLAIVESMGELKNTLSELKQRAGLLRFLMARMIYQDGVNGLLALGGTFAASMFGWQTIEMGIYGILLLVIAIGGCAVVGCTYGLKKRNYAQFVVFNFCNGRHHFNRTRLFAVWFGAIFNGRFGGIICDGRRKSLYRFWSINWCGIWPGAGIFTFVYGAQCECK